MTKWDYLRNFHAKYPEASGFEEEYLQVFDKTIFDMVGKRQGQEPFGSNARAAAAKAAEQEFLKRRKIAL